MNILPDSKKQKRLGIMGTAILASFALTPLFNLKMNPNAYVGGHSRDQNENMDRNSSSLATILGEIRTNISDFMFIKTERYLHGGVAYVVHTDLDALSSTEHSLKAKVDLPVQEKSESNDAHEHDHAETPGEHQFDFEDDYAHDQGEYEESAGLKKKDPQAPKEEEHEIIQTIVKQPKKDFRGFVGYLEREVKPWLDPEKGHRHTNGRELLPWYRLMTVSDPHNVRAYLIGAWWLKSIREDGQARRALEFVDEGIQNNPESFQLHLMRGFILNVNSERNEARRAFRTAADLAVKQRPLEGREKVGIWNQYQEEDARASIRMAVMMEKEAGSKEEALHIGKGYRSRIGEDGPLDRQIGELSGAFPVVQETEAPHMDHTPKHGGEFFMAADGFHHLEGTLTSDREFRIYFYDDHTRPINADKFLEGSTLRVAHADEHLEEVGDPVVLKLNLAEDRTYLLAQVPDGIQYPLTFRARINLSNREEMDLFNFDFKSASFVP